jgi:predicted flavoprotein YhiN
MIYDKTDLVIIGAGAAGLMAACHAGDFGLSTLLLERKHRVGSKLLMCGNGRCNLTSDLSVNDMLIAFGSEVAPFLTPAISAFSSADLQQWFKQHRLPLMLTNDGKIFPASEKASDVVHCFTDKLRDNSISICLNAPVVKIEKINDDFSITTNNFSVTADKVLIATGGVSYPKTGSVGDGQRFSGELGHHVTPFRPGLVGVAWESKWLSDNLAERFDACKIKIFDGAKYIAETKGLIECERWGLGGGAILNATRILSRNNTKKPAIEIFIPQIKQTIRIDNLRTRPLKEAMVTVGGVVMNEINPKTMESIINPGLYYAGEVLDIDGPTGGFNLTAAFATARLAVKSIAADAGLKEIKKISSSQEKRNKWRKKQQGNSAGKRYSKLGKSSKKLSYTEEKRQHWSKRRKSG